MEDRRIAAEISYQLVDLFKTTAPVPGFRMHVARWVIKNDDIDLLNSFIPVAITGATAAADSASTAALAAALATAVCTLVVIAKRLRDHAIILDDDQDAVLRALARRNGRARPEEIAADTDLGDADVRDVLVSLSEIRTASGERRSVVEADARGEWYLLDV